MKIAPPTAFACPPYRRRLQNRLLLRTLGWSTSAGMFVSVSGAATFASKTTLPTTQLKVNTGANLKISKSTELKLEYTGQFGRSYNSQTGALRLNHIF